jgi:glycerate 2-kinase
MNILIAPNAFKNSLPADEAAEAIREGLERSKLECSCSCFPIGDGGDGTGKLLRQMLHAETIVAQVSDPLGRAIQSLFGFVSATRTVIIEMADASGLRLISKQEFKPLYSSSFGTGQLIRQALEFKPETILLCLGGSATVDGGTGILHALGASFKDKNGNDVTSLPAGLMDAERLDVSLIDERIRNCEIIILCDVTNPVLGNEGSARIFGPQKGATADEVELLETALEKCCDLVYKASRKDVVNLKHGGAAGGVAATLHGILGAKLVSGIDYYLQATNFAASLKRTDIVITGEGSIDDQTLHGKGPFGVALLAKAQGIAVIGMAGHVVDDPGPELRKFFDALVPINPEGISLEEAIRTTRSNLVKASELLGYTLPANKVFVKKT